MAGFWQRILGWFGGHSGRLAMKPEPVYPGTRLENLQVLDVIDGDTLRVDIQGKEESLRLLGIDTEESQGGSDKPITRAGKLASEMAKAFFQKPNGNWCTVDIEFESNAPLVECLENERDTYGRLICYVFKGGENYNLHTVRGGWSPYFMKYGHSRFCRKEFETAQAEARAKKLVIWDPATNAGGPSRDYETLLPWWEKRGQLVDEYRQVARPKGAMDVRADYDRLVEAMRQGDKVSLFCDLQQGISKWAGHGAVLFVGTQTHPFALWIPHAKDADKAPLVEAIEKRYAGYGRGFAYVTGKVEAFHDKPQIVLTSLSQLTDSI